MIRSLRLIGALAAMMAVLAVGGGPADAAEGRVPLPELQGKGEKCVSRPTSGAADHPARLLKTHRDDTCISAPRGKYT
jgi:hypothetical protein